MDPTSIFAAVMTMWAAVPAPQAITLFTPPLERAVGAAEAWNCHVLNTGTGRLDGVRIQVVNGRDGEPLATVTADLGPGEAISATTPPTAADGLTAYCRVDNVSRRRVRVRFCVRDVKESCKDAITT
jgi:hypothetical protein